MAADAILATLLRTTGTDLVETTSLLERFSFLVDLFGETFVFDPDARVETLFSEALQRLVTLGAIEPAVQEAIDRETGPATTLGDGEAGEGDTRVSARPTQPEPVSVVLRHDGAAELEALAGLLRSHLDAVRVALRALGMLRHEQIPEKSFQKRAEAFARAMYMTEEVRHKEATNVFLLRTAWRRLERMGVLRRVGGDTDHAGGPRVSLDRDAWETVKQRLARCLEPGQA